MQKPHSLLIKTVMKKIGNFLLHRILPVLIVIVGILITAYPWISNYMYKDRVSDVITEYDEALKSMSKKQLEGIKKETELYNEQLRKGVISLKDPFDGHAVSEVSKKYASLVPVKNSELLGSIQIPKINVNLPIYRGTSQSVLQAGIGHLEGTSVPIGGKGTHSVLTGHTGLGNKKLFTDLNQMEKGDLFFLKVLGEIMCYKVTDINVVLPSDISKLTIQEEKDLCTLVTCTPYGINSHRLLVTGARTEYVKNMEDSQKKGDYLSDWRMEYLKCIIIGLCIAALMIVIVIYIRKKKNKKNVKTHAKL